MSPISGPTDRRFRRGHVKPARKRRWRTIGRRAAVYGVLLAALALAVSRGGEVVAHARVLQIDRLVVRGNERLPSATVLEALDGLRGQNLVWADLDEWRARLLASPWVKDAALRRSLPSTVEVSVSERTPVVVGRIDGRLYLIDEQGIIIDQYGPRYANFDLPIADGLTVAKPAPGVAADETRVALAARIVGALRGRPDIAKRLSQIDVSEVHNARVTLMNDSAVIHVGDDQFLQRIESYLQLADTLRASVPEIAYVDMRFGNRVYVGPAGRRSAVPAAAKAVAARRGDGK